MMDFPYGEAVTRLRARDRLDEYDETVEDWQSPYQLWIPQVAAWPTIESETLEPGRDRVTGQWTLAMPFNIDIKSGDRVIFHGETWNVEGEPIVWRSPFTGWAPGQSVQIVRMG